MMKIYTRTGDDGETGLLGGNRVTKDDVRIEAYGEVDELNSVIGVAIAHEPCGLEGDLLHRIQNDLFSLGANLASPDPEKVRKALEKARIDGAAVEFLEDAIDRIERRLEPLTSFILPGGTLKAAQLHVARSVCRRVERNVVRLEHSESIPAIAVTYLNRLSDLLFVLARLANREAGKPDIKW